MEFNVIKYEILYSNQLTKKNKTWKDGFLTYFPKGNKAYLYDESNKHIDSLYGINKGPELDEEIKFDKYIVLPQVILQDNQISSNNPPPQDVFSKNNKNENIGIYKKIPIIKKSNKKKKITKIYSTRSISQLLSLFPSNNITFSQNNNNIIINNNKYNLPTIENNDSMNIDIANNNNIPSNIGQDFELSQKKKDLVYENNKTKNNSNNKNNEKNHNIDYITNNIQYVYNEDKEPDYSLISNTSCSQNLFKLNNNDTRAVISNIREINHPLNNVNMNSYNNIKNSQINNNKPLNELKKSKMTDSYQYELKFPSSDECLDINESNLKRNTIIPVNFINVTEYQESFKKAILENIQIELFKLAIKYRSLPSLNESAYRSNGINFYVDCILTRFQPVFLKYKKKNNNCNYLLTIAKKEKSSSYSKDDIWIISINKNFEKNTTFLAKSVFYGPNGNSAVEVEPIGKNDIDISKYLTLNKKPIYNVYAIRSININTEEIIMNNLKTNITKSSVLPYLLNFNNTMKKRNDKKRFNSPSMISLINEKKINEFDEFLNDIIIQYKLNEDQETVLRTFVESLKSSSKSPITLVHGVFGAGKSLLISIIIFFLYRSFISGFINPRSNFKILVSSMTNVAVDRILLYLMEKFDFKSFVRVGSLKKIAKPLLPYAAQISKGNEDIDELNSLLKCEELSPTEVKYIQETIKKFKKNENRNNIHHSFLIATTCIASSFEILDNIKVPIVILDECSQFIEPLSLLPICRFHSDKLLLVGDPKQLSPTITTNSAYDKDPINKGLDRTLFERLALCQCTPILLRTQYRCNPIISNISNNLFYDNKLINGKKEELSDELLSRNFPVLCFVDINSISKSQFSSYINKLEADFIVKSIEKLVENGVNGEDIGVISLYKGQADLIKNQFYTNPIDKIKMIQVSTVDAFQGAEKSIIFLSIVKSNSSEFIDSDRRVNVAITRAKNHLILVGNKTNLIKFSVIWKNIIINHCEKTKNGILNPEQFYDLIKD